MTDIQWYISDRQQGKTAALIEWVKGGNKVGYYPGWDRIILVSSRQEADLLRGGDPETNKYGLEYHQVYYYEEWKNSYKHGVQGPVVLGIDNVEFFLNRMLFNTAYSRIAMITGTGEVIERA
jgi:hypothetical protein